MKRKDPATPPPPPPPHVPSADDELNWDVFGSTDTETESLDGAAPAAPAPAPTPAAAAAPPAAKRQRRTETPSPPQPPPPPPPPQPLPPTPVPARPHAWRLSKLHPSHHLSNAGAASLMELFNAAPQHILFADFMVDPVWLASAFPYLSDRTRCPRVTVWLADAGGSIRVPSHWDVVPMKGYSAYGSHHSKFVLAGYGDRLRLAIHTANLLYGDVNNKTQGVWSHDFPRKTAAATAAAAAPRRPNAFESGLTEYLQASGWREGAIDRLSAYDFSSVRDDEVQLVGSVPGRHTGAALHRWGHMKLRRCLQERSAAPGGGGANGTGSTGPPPSTSSSPSPPSGDEVHLQFSSVGSLNAKWVNEFVGESLGCGGSGGGSSGAAAAVRVVWPTVGEVRDSVEGYNGGRSIPGTTDKVAKMLALFPRGSVRRWGGNPARSRAPPHIKTYTRLRAGRGGVGTEAAWSVLTSANLSGAAWGKLEKNGTQLFIMNYELGLVFFPTAGRRLVPAACAAEAEASALVVPLPYAVPPLPYGAADEPWVCDKDASYGDADCFGVHGPVPTPLLGLTQD
eukprot:Rhum_TRINITY_DN14412_c7_g1::Rhum_TRINITY_DN14412_c7_g1_i1::g.87813::m.87813/K10862/TDP1; tyrosyl-DNA phosphodiesterase 1